MIINLVDIELQQIKIDYVNQNVTVEYRLIDAEGKAWGNRRFAVFHVTLPEIISDIDFQLPPAYLTTFVNLRADAVTAIKARLEL